MKLDSASLQVANASGVVLFGRIDPSHTIRAMIQHRGQASLVVTVALTWRQVTSPLIFAVPTTQLWHLAALLAATVLVLGIAVGSSRREALLARARSDFIAGVSHDLRMPLAQILLASETLSMRRERDERERLSLSSSIMREARRLVALVDNVLLFSRSGAVERRARLEPVTELFADVLEAVQLAADDAGDTVELQPGTSIVVLGDRQLLRQALIHLVDNALKYGGATS
ncbi:MAG: HAMP domain-containing histidine kinase [Gemmatimonadota bacterium]|nr:HAMP domain-containing histidine kinase [Gemmatimonadota bacterium]